MLHSCGKYNLLSSHRRIIPHCSFRLEHNNACLRPSVALKDAVVHSAVILRDQLLSAFLAILILMAEVEDCSLARTVVYCVWLCQVTTFIFLSFSFKVQDFF